MKIVLKSAWFMLLVFAPSKLFACAACYGANIDAPMAEGMNWGIFTLMAVIVTVLAVFLTFLIYVIRKSEALEAEAQKKFHSPEPAKV